MSCIHTPPDEGRSPIELRFHSLDQAPLQWPILSAILEDLGNPPPKRIASFLGVTPDTVRRWKRQDAFPKSAAIALFWLTKWGQSWIHTQAVNDAQLAASYLDAVRQENDSLRACLGAVQAAVASFASRGGLAGHGEVLVTPLRNFTGETEAPTQPGTTQAGDCSVTHHPKFTSERKAGRHAF